MDIFKNKCYKVFPLSIFITKCTEEKVTFNDSGKILIYKDKISLNETKLSFTYNSNSYIYQNNEGFIINKNLDINNFLNVDCYLDHGIFYSSKIEINIIKENLKDYCIGEIVIFNNDDKEVKLKNKIINTDYQYQLHYFPKLQLNNLKFKLNDKDFEITFKENLSEKSLYDIVYNYQNTKKTINYYDMIKEIIKNICSDYNENYILKKINNKAFDKNNNENNKGIYKDFLDCLMNGKNLTIGLGYVIEIKDVLLNDNLSKIYKIENSKKEEIIGLLNGEYEEKNYSELQKKLNQSENFKNIIIQTVENDTAIHDLSNVKITIIEDNGEGENRVITPKKCTIKFEAGNNLFITDNTNYPASKSINFSEDEGGITTDTNIEKYINTKYDKIKNNCIITSLGDNCGKFEDGTVVTVTINNEINGITSVKDPKKVYVKVQFKVSDDSKFRFKGSLVEKNEFNLVLEKNKKISNLLTEIVTKLVNKNLKDGYKIEKDNNIINDNEEELVDNAKYIITLANDDSNFVEKIEDKPEDKDKAKKDSLINECEKLLSDIKNLDSSYNEPINEDDSVENLESLKDKLTSKLNKLKNKKPEENNNNNNTNKTKYCGKEKGKKTKKSGKGCC